MAKLTDNEEITALLFFCLHMFGEATMGDTIKVLKEQANLDNEDTKEVFDILHTAWGKIGDIEDLTPDWTFLSKMKEILGKLP